MAQRIPRPTRLPWRSALALTVTGLTMMATWASPSAAGHVMLTNDGPITDAAGPDEWLTHRWSWVHVWESGRHGQPGWSPRFPLPELPASADPSQRDALREQAVAALADAIRPGRATALRQQAALALGRIGTEPASTALLTLLNDRDDAVSEVAWMALGLCDAPAARQRLLDPGTLNARQTLGWIMAIAVMDDPPRSALRTLAALVKQPRSAEVSRLAWWALRRRAPHELTDAARDVFKQSTDPWLVSEALLLLGQTRQTDLLGQFRTVLVTRGAGLIALSTHLDQTRGLSETVLASNTASAQMSAVRVSAAMALGQFDLPPDDRHGRRAREALRMLFESPPLPAAVHAQGQRGPARPSRMHSGFAHSGALPYESRFAALELGRAGHAAEAELLVRIVRTNHLQDAFGQSIRADHFARRGLAAMGLGLYLRRLTMMGLTFETGNDQGVVTGVTGDRALWRRGGPLFGEDPADTRSAARKAILALHDIAHDRQQPYALRAACVLAMGLSHSPERRQDITAMLAHAGRDEHPLVTAYAVLALAMLGEVDTPALAQRLLATPQADRPADPSADAVVAMRFEERLPAGDIMAIRALLQALAIVQSPIGADLAARQFGREPWTSRQAVLTLRALDDIRLVQPIIASLRHHPQRVQDDARRRGADQATTTDLPANHVATLAAWSLGHLLRPTAQDKLTVTLHTQANYTLPLSPLQANTADARRQDAILRLRALADPVFYDLLAPAQPGLSNITFRY